MAIISSIDVANDLSERLTVRIVVRRSFWVRMAIAIFFIRVAAWFNPLEIEMLAQSSRD